MALLLGNLSVSAAGRTCYDLGKGTERRPNRLPYPPRTVTRAALFELSAFGAGPGPGTSFAASTNTNPRERPETGSVVSSPASKRMIWSSRVVSAAKGLEHGTGRRLSEVIAARLGPGRSGCGR